MWVSVLVLGAAEHPVPLLPGPGYLSACLCGCQLPLIKTRVVTLSGPHLQEGFDVRTSCRAQGAHEPEVHE